jgi:phenylalanyl-tRNA synthetase beta chain
MDQMMRGAELTDLSETDSKDVVFKIDVPANRYDLLCVEGISRALKIFLGHMDNPEYVITTPEAGQRITITQLPETKSVRPFVVGAVLRNITFTQQRYDSFIALQDKLHENIGRHRSLVAIGTHDLDTLTPPFFYKAEAKDQISFAPLGESKVYNVNELFEHYRTDEHKQHLRPFLHLTESSPVHPVIYDSKDTVLSLPPIINGEHSKISLTTRNVFIECTGTDLTKLNITLDMVVSMFSEYCDTPFSIESVEVIDAGVSAITPRMESSEFKNVSVGYINNLVGIDWDGKAMADQLRKMQMPSVYDEKTHSLTVTVPHTRPDVLHMCDIAEDVAIVFGYDNIEKVLPPCMTIGGQVPLNHLTDLNRDVTAQAGFTEVLTWVLCARDDNFARVNKEDNGQCVLISKPKAREFNAVRMSLIPGLLKVVDSNVGQVQLPIRIFESGDVCLLDPTSETGAKNERRLAALFCARNSGVEEIHALVDRILAMNNCRHIPGSGAEAQALLKAAQDGKVELVSGATNVQKPYFVRASACPTFMDLRRADVFVSGLKIGHFGIIHPNVLAAYGVTLPCAALELNLELLL